MKNRLALKRLGWYILMAECLALGHWHYSMLSKCVVLFVLSKFNMRCLLGGLKYTISIYLYS